MEEKTICHYCAATSAFVVRSVMSVTRRIKGFFEKLYPEQSPGIPVTFKYDNPDAGEVRIAGSFTGWRPDPMKRKGHGNWEISFRLPEGKYSYKLLSDGNWIKDPGNKKSEPDPFGGENSVIILKAAHE